MNSAPFKLCFETLANDLRLQILTELEKGGPKPVSELVKALHAEQSRVSHSLEMLRACSYVNVEPKGKQRIYSLSESAHAHEGKASLSFMKLMEQHFSQCCHQECKKIQLLQPVQGAGEKR